MDTKPNVQDRKESGSPSDIEKIIDQSPPRKIEHDIDDPDAHLSDEERRKIV